MLIQLLLTGCLKSGYDCEDPDVSCNGSKSSASATEPSSDSQPDTEPDELDGDGVTLCLEVRPEDAEDAIVTIDQLPEEALANGDPTYQHGDCVQVLPGEVMLYAIDDGFDLYVERAGVEQDITHTIDMIRSNDTPPD